MIERKILIKNIPTNYKIIGTGRPMLILHGWGSDSSKWEKVAELLSQKNLQVIIPDLPGFGATPEPHSAWNLNNYMEWVNEFSEKVAELNRDFYLIGHSFGGTISVKFAIKYNQKIEKLFLVSAACIRKKTFIKNMLLSIAKFIAIFSFLPYYHLARKAFYKFIIKKSDYFYVSGVMKESYLRVVFEDLSWHLHSLKVKTIIIWGDKDDITPLEQAYSINKKISNSKLIILAGGVHGLQIKMPELLAEKILANI